ncbi:LOW QUALITY PROTEIN: hypothetical protein U0070_017298, partial [Myodes glareolus]
GAAAAVAAACAAEPHRQVLCQDQPLLCGLPVLLCRGLDRPQYGDSTSNISWFVRSFKYVYGLHFAVRGQKKQEVDGPCVIISKYPGHDGPHGGYSLSAVCRSPSVSCCSRGLIFKYHWGVYFINRQRAKTATILVVDLGDLTVKDNLKAKLVTSGTIRVQGLDAVPTSGLPEADVTTLVDACYQSMRDTFLQISQIPQNSAIKEPGVVPAQ